MATRKGVRLARFYYDDIQTATRALKAIELPWHTETDPYDPINGILSSKDAIAHRDACAFDRAAESFSWLALATRSEAVVLASLHGERLRRDAAATTFVVGRLSAPVSVPATSLVATGAIAGTKRGADGSVIDFEHLGEEITSGLSAFTFKRRRWTGVSWVWETWIPGAMFSATPVFGEAIYIGHEDLMFDRVNWTMATPNDGNTSLSVEYLDEGWKARPDGVVKDLDGAGTLSFVLSSALGIAGLERRDGLTVRVTYKPTGAYEDTVIQAATFNRIITSSYLDQPIPSTVVTDYEITTEWTPFRSAHGEISGVASPALAASGENDLTLPQTSTRKWEKATVDGVEAYWVRYRVTNVAGGAANLVASAVTEDDASWYVGADVYQGRTVNEEIGESDGSTFQAFKLLSSPFIEGSVSEINIDGDTEWEDLESLYYADGDTKGYVIAETVDEEIEVRFGNGTNGAIPSDKAKVRATYRVGAENDGNVGASEVVVQKTGFSSISELWNPRAATGWSAMEGGTPASLDALRFTFPARIRANKRAVTLGDYETMSVDGYETAEGGVPVARAIALEDGAGDETVLLVVSGRGGASLSASDLTGLGTYFNGTRYDLQREGGVGLYGVEATAVNYVARPVAVSGEVLFDEGYGSGKKESIEEALRSVLAPDATLATWKIATDREDDVVPGDYATFLWRLGGEVQRMRLSGIIVAVAGTGVLDVQNLLLDGAAANANLVNTELPTAGAIAITVTEV